MIDPQIYIIYIIKLITKKNIKSQYYYLQENYNQNEKKIQFLFPRR